MGKNTDETLYWHAGSRVTLGRTQGCLQNLWDFSRNFKLSKQKTMKRIRTGVVC